LYFVLGGWFVCVVCGVGARACEWALGGGNKWRYM
jgi:hypothetical protein